MVRPDKLPSFNLMNPKLPKRCPIQSMIPHTVHLISTKSHPIQSTTRYQTLAWTVISSTPRSTLLNRRNFRSISGPQLKTRTVSGVFQNQSTTSLTPTKPRDKLWLKSNPTQSAHLTDAQRASGTIWREISMSNTPSIQSACTDTIEKSSIPFQTRSKLRKP